MSTQPSETFIEGPGNLRIPVVRSGGIITPVLPGALESELSFHDIIDAFHDLNIDGKRYMLGKLGSCLYLLELSLDRTNGFRPTSIVNVGLRMNDPLDGFHNENGMGFHTLTFDDSRRLFVGTLGASTFWIRPQDWFCTEYVEEARRQPSVEHSIRAEDARTNSRRSGSTCLAAGCLIALYASGVYEMASSGHLFQAAGVMLGIALTAVGALLIGKSR